MATNPGPSHKFLDPLLHILFGCYFAFVQYCIYSMLLCDWLLLLTPPPSLSAIGAAVALWLRRRFVTGLTVREQALPTRWSQTFQR